MSLLPGRTPSFFPVHVQPDFFLAVWNRHIAFRRGNDDRLARRRWPELFRQVHLDRQHRAVDSHLDVLHNGGLSVVGDT